MDLADMASVAAGEGVHTPRDGRRDSDCLFTNVTHDAGVSCVTFTIGSVTADNQCATPRERMHGPGRGSRDRPRDKTNPSHTKRVPRLDLSPMVTREIVCRLING